MTAERQRLGQPQHVLEATGPAEQLRLLLGRHDQLRAGGAQQPVEGRDGRLLAP